jgi:hypothetical protein
MRILLQQSSRLHNLAGLTVSALRHLLRVMSIVTRPFVSRLAGSIPEVEGSLLEDLEGLVERARLEHGQKAAAIMRRYIKEVCSQQGGE